MLELLPPTLSVFTKQKQKLSAFNIENKVLSIVGNQTLVMPLNTLMQNS